MSNELSIHDLLSSRGITDRYNDRRYIVIGSASLPKDSLELSVGTHTRVLFLIPMDLPQREKPLVVYQTHSVYTGQSRTRTSFHTHFRSKKNAS